MQIQCIAIDDEPLALSLIRTYAARTPLLKLQRSFDDALSAMQYLNTNPVDLIFVDINMPDITGLELVGKLQPRPLVIFTTAYKNFAFEGFQLDAVDYLLKPISFERFEKAVQKAMQLLPQNNAVAEPSNALFVRAEYQLVRIDFNEIEYIESVQDYLKIHRTNQKPVMTLMTLKSILDKLPAESFRRIHRSYVIPVNKIRSVANRKVKLSQVELPVSDTYSDFLSGLR